MDKDVFETQTTIHIKINKPVYGSFVYIRDKYIDRAKVTGKKLVIETAGIKGVCTAKEWLKGAKKIKKVFLLPDHPMCLYGNHVAKFAPKPEMEKVDNVIMGLAGMPEEYKLQIKAKLGLR